MKENQIDKQAVERMIEYLNNTINVERNSYFGKGCITLPLIEADKILDMLKGYRKQSVGEWEFTVNHSFNDWGDLTVYATARCSECKKEYPFNPTVAREFVERPEELSYSDDWDINIESIKTEVLKQAKKNKNLYSFCSHCGAKMKGGAEG